MAEYRLFFALWPDEDLRHELYRAARVLPRTGPRAYPVRPDRYHLTLLYLGEVDKEGLEAARMAAETVQTPRFQLTIDRAGSFPRARVWWLGSSAPTPELRDLWGRLKKAVDQTGLPSEDELLTPHLTMTREARQAFAPKPLDEPIYWDVHEFVLINSVLSPKTSHYEIVGRWSLPGPAIARPAEREERGDWDDA